MKGPHITLVALAGALALTAVAAAGSATKQRVAISMKDLAYGTFVLDPLAAGPLERDAGTAVVTFTKEPDGMREGQTVHIYRTAYRLSSKRGTLRIRERLEWVDVSDKNAPGFEFRPGVAMGTWKVTGGTGVYAGIKGAGRSGHAGMGAQWLVRQEGFLTLP